MSLYSRTPIYSDTPVTICCKSVPPSQHGPWMRAQAACNPAICCAEAGRPCEFDIERPRLECEMEPRLCAPGLPVPRLGVVEFGLPCLLVLASRVDAAGVGKVALAKANTGLVCPLCGCELVGDSGSSIFAGVAGATCFLEGVVEEKVVEVVDIAVR